jgi:hypothetical protein
MAFAVKAGAVATPLALVTALAVAEPLKVELAPLPGTVNVTVTFGTGLLFASATVASNDVANPVLMTALCGVPAEAVIAVLAKTTSTQ